MPYIYFSGNNYYNFSFKEAPGSRSESFKTASPTSTGQIQTSSAEAVSEESVVLANGEIQISSANEF